MASRSSSVYFRRNETSVPEVSSSPSGLGNQSLSTSHGRQSHYASSATCDRPSMSRPPTARPSTASGRKSRATTASSVLGFTDSQSIICAVSEARGVSPSVGLATVNVSIGEVVLSQICDNQSYVKTIHKIQISGPSRVLFMSTTCPPNKPSTLFSLVQELIPEAQAQAVDRSSWSETAGIEYIQNLAFKDDIEPLKVAVNGKFYAVSSFAAVCSDLSST